MAKIHLPGEKVEAVVGTGASASVVGQYLVHKLGIWKSMRKVKIRQRDGSFLRGNSVVNTCFKVNDYSLVLVKFAIVMI